MVTMDDQTYAILRDNIYKGNEAAASAKRAQIENTYDEQKYNNLKSSLSTYATQTANQNQTTTPASNTTPASTPSNTQTTDVVKQDTVIKQGETPVNTVSEIPQQGKLKPQLQDYYNQTSTEAQDKIINNLNGYRQSNPELFSSYEDFKNNFSYDYRTQTQKDTLDNWYKGYTKGMELSGLPVQDLYTQYKDGTISNSDLELLRVSNVAKYNELQNTINKGNIIAAYDDDKGVDTTGMNLQDLAYNAAMQMFTKFMSGDSSSGASQYFRDYEEKMNNPEMLALSDQCTEVQEQMENVQSDLDSIKKSVEAEYEGTGATRSKINAIIADRSYDLQLQLRTLNSEYTKYATQYNNRMNQYQNEFQMQLQEYQLNQDARNQQMKELGFAMDLMNFETPQQAQERQWDYWVKQQEYTNGNINSKDYQTRYKAALNSVQNLLSQYEGIPMKRSAEQMAQDILKAIDNGSDLGGELTKLNQQIQSKPEYRQIYNATYGGTTSSNGMIEDTFKVGDTEWVKYNGQWMTADEFNSKRKGTGTAKPYDVVSEDMFKINNPNGFGGFIMDSKNTITSTGGQCGHFVNNYLEKIGVGRYYDDNLSTKLNSVNTSKDAPKVGTIAVFDYDHKSSDGINHGHVGIVTQVFKDGSFTVLDSNFDGDEKIQLRTIRPGSSSLKGFFDPSKGPSSTTDTTTNQTSTDRLTLTALRNGQIVNSKVPDTIEQLVKAGFSEEEINEALNQNMEYYLPDDQRAEKNAILNTFRNNDIVKNFQSSTEQLLGLSAAVEQENGAGDLASIYMFMRAQDPKSVVREGEFEMAASTMGLGGQVETWFTKLANGQRLTPEQRQNFIDVTVKVLEAKKQAYQIVYDEAVQQMKAASIPSVYYPKDWTKEIDGIISKLTGGDTTDSNNSVSALNTVKASLNNLSANIQAARNNQTDTKGTLQSLFGIK